MSIVVAAAGMSGGGGGWMRLERMAEACHPVAGLHRNLREPERARVEKISRVVVGVVVVAAVSRPALGLMDLVGSDVPSRGEVLVGWAWMVIVELTEILMMMMMMMMAVVAFVRIGVACRLIRVVVIVT